MINSVGGNIPSILRAQQVTATPGANSAASIAQKIIDLPQNAQNNAVAKTRAGGVTQTSKLAFAVPQSNKPLPRGSLVDTVA